MTNDQTVTQAPLPCPWCQGGATVATYHAGGLEWAQVSCDNDGCSATGPCASTEDEAIAAWNTRTAHSGEGDLKAEIFQREDEWVLEISGTIDDTSFVCRHTEPLTTPKANVAGLPSLYSGEGRSNGAGDADALRHALTDAISMLDHVVEQTGYASGSGAGDYAAQEELSDHREKWRAALAQPEAGGEHE